MIIPLRLKLCFGADKIQSWAISDFVYPISPLIDNGRHKTYCGEFFQLIKLLNDDCWIHWSNRYYIYTGI